MPKNIRCTVRGCHFHWFHSAGIIMQCSGSGDNSNLSLRYENSTKSRILTFIIVCLSVFFFLIVIAVVIVTIIGGLFTRSCPVWCSWQQNVQVKPISLGKMPLYIALSCQISTNKNENWSHKRQSKSIFDMQLKCKLEETDSAFTWFQYPAQSKRI